MLLLKVANAAESAANSSAGVLLKKVTAVIVNPIITLFFIMALSIFVFGVFEFIKGSDSDEARSKGQQHMKWGIIGLFLMVAVFAIIQILFNLVNGFGDAPELWILK